MNRIQCRQAEMEFVDIPRTSIRVSRIALGTWAIGGWMWGGSNESDAIDTIHAALDRGINLIDTAPVYGFGRSEEIVGKALAIGSRRKRAFIATKVGLDWKDGQPFRNARKARIIEEAENSLRRLRTDVIDLYQVHWPDPNTPIAEVADAMAELHRAGKIRAIGVSRPAALQSVRTRDRTGCSLLLPRPQHRGACLWRAVPGPIVRQHDQIEPLRRRRSAQERSQIPRAAIRAIPRRGRALGSIGARAFQPADHPSCRALGARSRRCEYRIVGRAAR
jgi:CBS domain-containing protein